MVNVEVVIDPFLSLCSEMFIQSWMNSILVETEKLVIITIIILFSFDFLSLSDYRFLILIVLVVA
jgi:hypothetical protein